MKFKITIFIFSFFAINLHSQKKSNYKIYQFENNDSLNGHLSKIVKFNVNGLKNYVKEIDYKESKLSYKDENETFYFYKDTLLIKKLINYPKRKGYTETDSIRFEYIYNSENKLISEKEYKHYRNQKPRKFSDGCLIDSTDFEKNIKWHKGKFIYNFKYNNNGKLTLKCYIYNTFTNSEYCKKYKYDEKNLLIMIESYENNVLKSIKHYNYVENGHDYYYNPTINNHNTVYFVRETNGNNIKKQIIPDYYEIITYLNNKGLIIKKEKYKKEKYDSKEKKIELTLYIYKVD